MPLRTEDLPSVTWWVLLRTPPIRRFAACMQLGVPCAPMDAVLAGLLEAWAPAAFVEEARRRLPTDERELARRTARDVEDVVWEGRVRRLMERAADELGAVAGLPGQQQVVNHQVVLHRAEVLAILEEDENRPGLPRPLSTRPSGRRRQRPVMSGAAARRREFARCPWLRWFA